MDSKLTLAALEEGGREEIYSLRRWDPQPSYVTPNSPWQQPWPWRREEMRASTSNTELLTKGRQEIIISVECSASILNHRRVRWTD